MPDTTTARFEEAGFRIDWLEDVDEAVGHAHMILTRPDGTLWITEHLAGRIVAITP